MFAFSLRKFFWGLVIAGIGGLIWADNLELINLSFKFSRDWPLIIVAIGLMSIWDALFGRQWWGHKAPAARRGRANTAKILEDLEAGRISAEEAARLMGDK